VALPSHLGAQKQRSQLASTSRSNTKTQPLIRFTGIFIDDICRKGKELEEQFGDAERMKEKRVAIRSARLDDLRPALRGVVRKGTPRPQAPLDAPRQQA